MTAAEKRCVAEALRALAAKKAVLLARAKATMPPRPGLYGIHAAAAVWRELGLGRPPDRRPLYVGKAEDSLISRDIGTHFGDGRSGQSTVRRSFAALLHDALGLQGMPRNPDKPAYFANYGLSPKHDELLTAWMLKKLRIAVWPKPPRCEVPLLTIERAVLTRLQPPLNLKDVVTPWATQVSIARKVMADEARAWSPPKRRP